MWLVKIIAQEMLQYIVERPACQIWCRSFTFSVIAFRDILSERVIREYESRVAGTASVNHDPEEGAVSKLQDLDGRTRRNETYRSTQHEDAESCTSNNDMSAPADASFVGSPSECDQLALAQESPLCLVSLNELLENDKHLPGGMTESESRNNEVTGDHYDYVHDLCPAECSPCPACIGRSVLFAEAQSSEIGELESQIVNLTYANQQLSSTLDSQSRKLRQQISALEIELCSTSESLDQVRSRELMLVRDNSRLKSDIEQKAQKGKEHVSELAESIKVYNMGVTQFIGRHQAVFESEIEGLQSMVNCLRSQVASLEKENRDLQAANESLQQKHKALLAFSKQCATIKDRLCAALQSCRTELRITSVSEQQLRRSLRRLRLRVLCDKNTAKCLFTELVVLQITMRRNLGLDALRVLRRWAEEELIEMLTLRSEQFNKIFRAHTKAIRTGIEHDMTQSSTERFQDFSFKLVYPFFDTGRARGSSHRSVVPFADPSVEDEQVSKRQKHSHYTDVLPDLLSSCSLEDIPSYVDLDDIKDEYDPEEGNSFADEQSEEIGDFESEAGRSGLLKDDSVDSINEDCNDVKNGNQNVTSEASGSTYQNEVHPLRLRFSYSEPTITSGTNNSNVQEYRMINGHDNSYSSSISSIHTSAGPKAPSTLDWPPSPASSSSSSEPFVSVDAHGSVEDISSEEGFRIVERYHRFPSCKKGKLRVVNV